MTNILDLDWFSIFRAKILTHWSLSSKMTLSKFINGLSQFEWYEWELHLILFSNVKKIPTYPYVQDSNFCVIIFLCKKGTMANLKYFSLQLFWRSLLHICDLFKIFMDVTKLRYCATGSLWLPRTVASQIALFAAKIWLSGLVLTHTNSCHLWLGMSTRLLFCITTL